MANESKFADPGAYAWSFPEKDLCIRDHFSSLLLSGDVCSTLMELLTLGSVTAAAALLPPQQVNVEGSMSLKQFAAFLWTKAAVARLYNTYCEAVFFACPQYRIQPSREHALVNKKDLMGRTQKDFETICFHDKLTLLSQFALNVGLYYALPGYYPAADVVQPWPERILRLLGNHYLMSFSMYWMHRGYHVVPFLWKYIHSYHHWAKHPLSRNTYQDHWLDNFGNAIVGHLCASILIPLDNKTFWFSQLFRVFESLEKHSGVSCSYNLAHTMQRWLPFAQMPHHHDWHHEGHKSCNYTFTSIGGLWDCLFGTRKAGRAKDLMPAHTTREDKKTEVKIGRKSILDHPIVVMTPVVSVAVLAAYKLKSGDGRIKLRA